MLIESLTSASSAVALRGAIPESEHDRAFRCLFRLDGSRTTVGNGSGLSSVSSNADMHIATTELPNDYPGPKVAVKLVSGEISKAHPESRKSEITK